MPVWLELVDTPALEAGVERRAGSSPAMGTYALVTKMAIRVRLKI